ncbi:MAG TPA: hypothetical protein VGL05_31515, partial [Kribbella sp.]
MEGLLRNESGNQMLTTFVAVGTLITSVLMAPAAVATDPPPCRRDVITGECELQVSDDGNPPKTSATTTPGTKKPGGSACVFKGEIVPCRTDNGFFHAASGCYLTLLDGPVGLRNSNDPGDYPPGTKFYRCFKILGVVEGKPLGRLDLESVNIPPAQTRTIDPRVAARRVVETMTFVAPQLGLSPYVQSANHVGIVNVPIWMWVTDPGPTTTGPQTKTAALGGVSI